MPESDEITVFGIRAGGPYILVTGAHKVRTSSVSYHHEYLSHWTGTEWEESNKGKACDFDFDYKKYAEEYVQEHKDLLLAELRKRDRS
jgi:hypothetical protein